MTVNLSQAVEGPYLSRSAEAVNVNKSRSAEDLKM